MNGKKPGSGQRFGRSKFREITLNICSVGKSQTELGSPDHKDDFSVSQGSLGGAGKTDNRTRS